MLVPKPVTRAWEITKNRQPSTVITAVALASRIESQNVDFYLFPEQKRPALIAEAVDLEDITLETVASETYWKLSVVLPHRGGEDTMANQRSGPTDVVDFIFLSTFTRFEEAAPTAWGE